VKCDERLAKGSCQEKPLPVLGKELTTILFLQYMNKTLYFLLILVNLIVIVGMHTGLFPTRLCLGRQTVTWESSVSNINLVKTQLATALIV